MVSGVGKVRELGSDEPSTIAFMTIVIECTPKAMFALFDSKTISPGMRREVPGGATIQLGQMPMEKRGLPSIQATLVPILIEFGKVGKDVAIGVFSAWLYDKLKGKGEERKFMRVNRVMVEVTPEAITKVLTESIEIEGRATTATIIGYDVDTKKKAFTVVNFVTRFPDGKLALPSAGEHHEFDGKNYFIVGVLEGSTESFCEVDVREVP